MIYEKLQKARVLLQEKKIKKSGKNKYSGFAYYELSDFLPYINKIFNELKIFSNFSIENNTAKLVIYDCEDETCTVFTSPVENLELKGCTRIQALGGVHTYLKRYLYLNALEIVENDILDINAGKIEEVLEDDIDIYSGLTAVDTPENALKYYREYQDKVNDKERFKNEYAKVYKKLKQKEREI